MIRTDTTTLKPVGRFAPSPSGRMHLGNVFTALLSLLSVKSREGKWILRIEDLDPERSRHEYSRLIEDDLHWLGLDWDEGGLDGADPAAPYVQSLRSDLYKKALTELEATGLTYPCFCTRADIMATQAPHQCDGRIVYPGKCRPARFPSPMPETKRRHSVRIYVPHSEVEFTDCVHGKQRMDPASVCGDFVLRRADGAWAYQLAVVVDDWLMGVTEVVRGYDLILSAAQQTYLYKLLGAETPVFAHVPLLCNSFGQRLSKRDRAMSMEELRKNYSPEQIIGRLAYYAGLKASDSPISVPELTEAFSWEKIPCTDRIILD